MTVDSARRVLARTAAEVGGMRKLASELGLSERTLRCYILGEEPIPEGLVLRVIDVLLERLPQPPKTQ
jgi:predicted transcriptional regulator